MRISCESPVEDPKGRPQGKAEALIVATSPNISVAVHGGVELGSD